MRHYWIRKLFDWSVAEDYHSKFVNPAIPATIQPGWASYTRLAFTQDMDREWPLFHSLYADVPLSQIRAEIEQARALISGLPPLADLAECVSA